MFFAVELLFGVNTDLFAVFAEMLKFHLAVDQGKQRIIGTSADIIARMNVSSALLHQNVSGQYKLTVRALYAETFRLGVTAVFCGTIPFL